MAERARPSSSGVVSFHFGLPAPALLQRVSNRGGLVAPAGIPIQLLSRAPDEVVIGSALLGEIASGQNEVVSLVVEDPAETAGNGLYVPTWSPPRALLPFDGDGHVAMFSDPTGCTYDQIRQF